MKYDYDVNRVYKTLPRTLAWDAVKGVAKAVLLLPGRDCLDIKQGLTMGKINLDTHLVLFEKDKEIAKIIVDTVKGMGFKKFDVRNYKVQWHSSERSDLNNEGFPKFDLAFLDFCGEITDEVADFIRDNFDTRYRTSMSEDGVLCFTFSTQLRNNNFAKKYGGYGGEKFNLPAESMLWENSRCREKAIWICDAILSEMELKSGSLRHFITYVDTRTPMLFFSIKTIKERKEKKEAVKKQNAKSKTAPVYSGTLSPQQRAWVTIRRNKLQQEYDAATTPGVKAWIKRRMNLLTAPIEVEEVA